MPPVFLKKREQKSCSNLLQLVFTVKKYIYIDSSYLDTCHYVCEPRKLRGGPSNLSKLSLNFSHLS